MLPENYFRKSVLALSVTTAIALSSSVTAKDKIDFNSEVVNAAEYGNLQKLEGLVYMGADINEVGDFDTTALIRATYQGSKQIVEFLLTNGANPSITDMGGATALHIAAREGYAEIAKMLVEAGAKVNQQDGDGNTPLMRASAEGHEEIASLLVASGADVNKTNDSGESAIVYATETNNESVVARLVESGATKNIIDEDGYSVDEIASRKGNEILVAKLDAANSNHIELFVTKAAPKLDSKKVLYKLEEDKKIDFAGATTLGPSYNNQPSKDWLNGLKQVFDAAGAFELASVKNYEAGSTYILLDLGSFKDKEFADRRLAQLRDNYGSTFEDLGLTIMEKGSNDQKTYNVSAGILNDKNEAMKICKELVAGGINCRPVESALITAEQFGQFSVPLADAGKQLDIKPVEMPSETSKKSVFDVLSTAPEVAVAEPEIKTVQIKKLDNSVTKAPAEKVVAKDLEAPKVQPVKVTAKKVEEPKLEVAKAEDKKSIFPVSMPSLSDILPKASAPKPVVEVAAVEKVEAPKLPEIKKIVKVEPPKQVEVKLEENLEDNLLDIAGMSNEVPEVVVNVPKAPVIEAPKVVIKKPEPVIVAKAKEPVIPEVKAITVADVKPVKKAKYVAEKPVVKKAVPAVAVANEDAVQDDEISNILRDIFAEEAQRTPPKDEPVQLTLKQEPVKVNKASSLPPLTQVNKVTTAKPEIKIVVAEEEKTPIAEPVKVSLKPSNEKFKVSTPIKVTELAPKPGRLTAKTVEPAMPTKAYNPQNGNFDVVGSKWVRISYFQSPGVARGYWNTTQRNNPNLANNLRMRTVKAINSGNSFHAAHIGPFLNNSDALRFCDSYAPKGTRCQVHKNVRDNYAPLISRRSTESYGHRGRHSSRRSTYGY